MVLYREKGTNSSPCHHGKDIEVLCDKGRFQPAVLCGLSGGICYHEAANCPHLARSKEA